MVEPWLRGTLTEVDTVRRGVLHALELAREDVALWCNQLTEEQLEARPFGLPSVGLPAFPGARQPRSIRTFVQGGALAAAISLSPACGLGFRRPTHHLKQMASAVNRVSEARFPAQTLKQRAAGGHQSSWCAAAEMELGRGA